MIFKSLDDIEKEIASGDFDLKEIIKVCHPDRFVTDPKEANRAATLLHKAYTFGQCMFKLIVNKIEYEVKHLLVAGDTADIYVATANNTQYLLKCSRDKGGDSILARERDNLKSIFAFLQVIMEKDALWHYFPHVVGSALFKDGFNKRVNVFEYDKDLHSLEEMKEKYPSLDPRHIVWIFKRCLLVLDAAHRAKISNNSMLPCHILVNYENHGVRIVGWGNSLKFGQTVKDGVAEYSHLYAKEVIEKKGVTPNTDVHMLCNSMMWLSSGLPRKMELFFKGCLLDSRSDAFELYDEFNTLAKDLFGPTKFVKLT